MTSSTGESKGQGHYLAAYLVLAVGFCTDQVFSMLMAFYPQVLIEKGLSPSATGLLFGSFAFAAMCSTFFATEISRKYGSYKTLTVSVVILALVTFAFAFTNSIEDMNSYFSICLILRILQGLAGGILEIVGLAILMRSVPPEKAGDSAAWMESVRALGLLCGPLVGSLMYSWQGYMAPFLLSTLLIGSIATAMIVSGFSSNTHNETTSKGNETTFRMMQSPIILACIATIILSVAALTFMEPTLQPFMIQEPYNLTDLQVSLVYTSSVVAFGVASGCSGEVTAIYGEIPTLVYSMISVGFGFLINAPPEKIEGPLSLFAFLYSERFATHQMVLGCLIIGAGVGFSVTPYTNLLINEGKLIGLDINASSDAISTFSAVSYSIGAALGPSISGVLVDSIGFRHSCAFFGYFTIVLSLFVLYFMGGTISKRKSSTLSSDQTLNNHESGKLIADDTDDTNINNGNTSYNAIV